MALDKNALEDKYNAEGQLEAAASNATFDEMISQSDGHFQSQIDATNQWAETQKQNQQAQTDFTIEQVEQQKDQAQKDYTREQSGAYVDWQKQSNAYGVNAEKMAANGMQNTGYSESSQVAMYNQYQNRVMAARESYNKAVLNYDNAITQARLQNSAVLAEIAYNALQKQLELSLEGFQYKNQLVLEKATREREIKNDYYQRYLAELDQINTENSQALGWANLEFDKYKFAYENGMYDNDGEKTDGGEIEKDNTEETISPSTEQTDGSNELAPDYLSIQKLGLKDMSAENLNKLIEDGLVVEYEKDGKLAYAWSWKGISKKHLYQ